MLDRSVLYSSFFIFPYHSSPHLIRLFYLFLSSPFSQTLWNTVPAAQAPCLCLAASCLKQASRLTPSTSTTPAATAHSKMAEWSSSSTMRITLVEGYFQNVFRYRIQNTCPKM